MWSDLRPEHQQAVIRLQWICVGSAAAVIVLTVVEAVTHNFGVVEVCLALAAAVYLLLFGATARFWALRSRKARESLLSRHG